MALLIADGKYNQKLPGGRFIVVPILNNIDGKRSNQNIDAVCSFKNFLSKEVMATMTESFDRTKKLKEKG